MFAGRCDTSQVSLYPKRRLYSVLVSLYPYLWRNSCTHLHTIWFYVCTRSNNFIVCKIIASLRSSCARKSIHLPSPWSQKKERKLGRHWESKNGDFHWQIAGKSSPKQLARKQWMSQYFGLVDGPKNGLLASGHKFGSWFHPSPAGSSCQNILAGGFRHSMPQLSPTGSPLHLMHEFRAIPAGQHCEPVCVCFWAAFGNTLYLWNDKCSICCFWLYHVRKKMVVIWFLCNNFK